MEFDKSRVYSTVNADEIKIGSLGYFEDTLESLKVVVEDKNSAYFGEIGKIKRADVLYRFGNKYNRNVYSLFYLVSEPSEMKEPKYRPYRNVNEFWEDYDKTYCVWLKYKESGGCELVSYYNDNDNTIWIGGTEYTMEMLLNTFTNLNDDPVGVREK